MVHNFFFNSLSSHIHSNTQNDETLTQRYFEMRAVSLNSWTCFFLPHVSGFVVLDYYLRQAKSRRQEGDVFPLHFFPVSRTTISTMQRGCSKNKQAQLCFRAELFHASFIIVKTPPVLGDLCGGLHSCECHFSFGFQTISISCVNFPFFGGM